MFAIGTYSQLLAQDITREKAIFGYRPFAGMIPPGQTNLVQVLIEYFGSMVWINTNPDDVTLYN